jgi:hypothetical protein
MVKAADMEDFFHGSGECIPASRLDVGLRGGVQEVDVFFAKGVVDLEDHGGEGIGAVVEIVVRNRIETETEEARRGDEVSVGVVGGIQVLWGRSRVSDEL